MRFLLLSAVFCLILVLVSSSELNPWFRNRRDKQFRPSPSPQVKGEQPGVKGYNPPRPLELRKGEYECGNKVCRLKPGEIPKGCKNGFCQYPV